MGERFTSIVPRDDGFLEVTLKNKEDFDDYIYQQMLKDGGCLPCVRDHRNACVLFYDSKGYISLRAYMKSYTFDRQESCLFLMYVLERMIAVNTSKPVYMDLDSIFVSYDGGALRFLVIPVAMDQWLFQKQETANFLAQIIKEIKISQGFEAVGYLAYMQRFEEITLPMILQGLHDVYDQCKHKQTLLEKLFHIHDDVTYVMKDIPLPNTYPRFASVNAVEEEALPYAKDDVHQETLVLLENEHKAKLVALQSGEEVEIVEEDFTIGRGKENALCIQVASVSFHHACIHKSTLELEDLASSNGTYVNEQPITHRILKNHDVIRFANQSFRLMM